jgi:hypothetical protein
MASILIERDMYGGRYHLVHNPHARGRQPRYLVNGTQKPKGVTTILGSTLSKDLMQWAVDCALDYLKDKIPMVTADDLREAGLEYTRRRDGGASTGTEAHALVEHFLRGNKPVKGENSQEAVNAYNAFVKWFAEVTPEVLNVEEVIYSENYAYAGTYDCMLKIDGKVYLCDLKTTNSSRKAPNGIYAEYFLQLGAYSGAHHEQLAFETDNGGSELVKIDGLMVISAKKNGKLDIVTNEDLGLELDACEQKFRDVVGIHNFLQSTTKLLGGK